MSESFVRWKQDYDKQQQVAAASMRRGTIAIIATVGLLFVAGIAFGAWATRVHDRNARTADAQALIKCLSVGFNEPQCTFMISNNRRLANDADTAALAAVSVGLAATAAFIAKQ